MSEFFVFLQLGFEHIADITAYDHILFIVALCAVYKLHQWRQVLILVTAFTIGHSITLAMATFGVFLLPTDVVEFLIPVTIFLTALHNVIDQRENVAAKMRLNYFLAMFFGLIHGIGFSNYLRALLLEEESLVVPLFSFNAGLELGQLLIVTLTIGAGFIILNVFQAKHREWNLFISGAAAGIALTLMIETRFW